MFVQKLGKDFLKWVIQEISDGRINPDDSVNRFPIHWFVYTAVMMYSFIVYLL